MVSTKLATLKARVTGGGFFGNVAMLAGGAAAGQALVILTSPIASRLYSPQGYGVVAVYISVLLIIGGISALKYEMAIPMAEDDKTAANLLSLSLLLTVVVSALSGLALYLVGGSLVRWTKTPQLAGYLWLIPVGMMGTGFYQCLSFWAVRKKAYKRIAATKVNQSISSSVFLIAMGLFKLDPLGLMVAHIMGQAGGGGTLATQALKEDRETLKGISREGMSSAARRYKRFPLISSPSNILNSMGLYLPAVLIAAFFGPKCAGWFALAQRVIAQPMIMVGQAVSQVYYGEASRLLRDDPAGFYRLFVNTTRKLLMIAGIPALLFMAIAPELIGFIFGKRWYAAGQFVQILTPAFVLQFVFSPVSQVAALTERQDVQFFGDAVRLVAVVLPLYLVHRGSGNYMTGIMAYSCAMSFAYIMFGVFYWRIAHTIKRKAHACA